MWRSPGDVEFSRIVQKNRTGRNSIDMLMDVGEELWKLLESVSVTFASRGDAAASDDVVLSLGREALGPLTTSEQTDFKSRGDFGMLFMPFPVILKSSVLFRGSRTSDRKYYVSFQLFFSIEAFVIFLQPK